MSIPKISAGYMPEKSFPITPEEYVQNHHRKECRLRHNMRPEVKCRDVQRLRHATFSDMMEALKKSMSSSSSTEVRNRVLEVLREGVEGVEAAFWNGSHALKQKAIKIFERYSIIKAQEKVGDDTGITIPGAGTIFGPEYYQFLCRIGGSQVVRHFVCRNTNCSKEGHFYGRNTDWISTVADGGWRFMCPICHLAYQPNTKMHAGVLLLPAQFVLQLPEGLILSAWPGSAEENALAEMMLTLAEDHLGKEAHRLNDFDLKERIWEVTNRHCVEIPTTRNMELSAEIRQYVKEQNRDRTKQQQWSFAHLADGFRGGFFKYNKEQTFIMSTEETKIWLALIHEAMQRRVNNVFKTSES